MKIMVIFKCMFANFYIEVLFEHVALFHGWLISLQDTCEICGSYSRIDYDLIHGTGKSSFD
jgi:hypothetical protein